MRLYYLGIVGRGSLEALNGAVVEIRFSFGKEFWCQQGLEVGGDKLEAVRAVRRLWR